VIAALVAATVVAVMLVVVMQKAGLSADRAGRIIPLARAADLPRSRPRAVGDKLVVTHPAKILLIPIGIFAVSIKAMIVVAFRAANLV
jgi:hypothetical protein